MQSSFLKLAAALVCLSLWTACGGDDKNNDSGTNTPVKVQITPSSFSLGKGTVTAVGASVLNKNDEALSGQTITFSTANAQIADISPSGSLCAGKWDDRFIVCTPFAPPGGGPITTVTETKIKATSGSLSTEATVRVHEPITQLVITPPATASSCPGIPGAGTSKTKELTFGVQAFSSGTDITGTVNTAAVVFSAGNANVVTVDTAGKATAKNPGQTTIFARLSSVNSVALPFTTCPPQTITLGEKDKTPPVTSFTLDATNTRTLAFTVVDTLGATITDVPLLYTSSASTVANVSSANVLTAAAAGNTVITAVCTPPTCNAGLSPVFSNPVSVKVNGTSNATVYVSSTLDSNKSLVPIDIATNTLGTAITLPNTPNSILINAGGTRAFLGSSAGLMPVELASNTVGTTVTSAPGRVMAVSPSGTQAVVDDRSNGRTVLVDFSSTTNSVSVISVANLKAAAFTVDNSRLYLAAGASPETSHATELYVYTPATGALRQIAAGQSINDLEGSFFGPFAYVANAAGVDVRSVCESGAIQALTVPSSLIAQSASAARVVTASAASVASIAVSPPTQNCPADPAFTTASTALPANAAILGSAVTSDGAKAVLTYTPNTGSPGGVFIYDTAANIAVNATFNAAAAVSAPAALLDGRMAYVGGSDKTVHRVDLSTNTDAQQITVPFTPDLVAIRPR